MTDPQEASLRTNRRQFLRTSGAAILGGALIPRSRPARGAFTPNGDTLRVGLVGCGGRGTGAAAQALKADPNSVLTAMADVFDERARSSLRTLKEAVPDRVQVDPDHLFVGLDAYQRVIDSGIDVVLLATPPGFRPLHFKASVEAGKQIFIEKPMATDAPGLRSVMETVQLSKKKGLSVVAGFCWRYDLARRAFYEQVHAGAVGDIRAIYATYYTGPVKPMPPEGSRPPGVTDLEWQLQNWYNFVWLCGDGLVEQAVHSVDKIAWAMHEEPPLRAVAVGGRQLPNPGGNIYDHFEVNYEYANGVRAFMGCRQQSGCYSQNADYVMGSKGVGTIGVRPVPEISGENSWRYRGERNNMYQQEHDELFASIRAGRPINDGDRMCSSTMMAIMGRMAAYTGQQVSWDEALNSQENLYPANLTWETPLQVRPMAMPGRTPLV